MQQARRRRQQHNDNNAVGRRRRSTKTTLLPLITYNDDDRYHDKHNSGVSAYLKRRGRLVVYAAATTTIIILFIISICLLLTSNPKLLFTNQHYGNTQQAARRISSSENANLTEFITCIDDVSREPYLSKITPFLPDRRKKSRNPKYSSLSCTPSDPNHCFRGVYDAFIDDLLPLVKQKGEGNPLIHNRIARIIEHLIRNPGIPLQKNDYGRDELKPTMLTPSINRHKIYYYGKDETNELHADYLESDKYVFTAILYDDHPENLVGGETSLVNFRHDDSNDEEVTFGMTNPKGATPPIDKDSPPQPFEISDGIIVQPKPGRLVIFSSGAENFHSPMVVKQGNRPTYHFWFKCKES